MANPYTLKSQHYKGMFKLKSDVRVLHRQFQPEDTATCSYLVLSNLQPLLEKSLGSESWNRDFVRVYDVSNLPNLAAQRDYWVAEKDGQVVGLVGFDTLSCPERGVELCNLSVDPKFQKSGVGTLLASLGYLRKLTEGVRRFWGECNAVSEKIALAQGLLLQPDYDSVKYGGVLRVLVTPSPDVLLNRVDEVLSRLVVHAPKSYFVMKAALGSSMGNRSLELHNKGNPAQCHCGAHRLERGEVRLAAKEQPLTPDGEYRLREEEASKFFSGNVGVFHV